jgi:hypothetical protein
MLKLYVGARRRVFVTGTGARDYQLCANGAASSTARLAFAILADHLGDRERALTARGRIERIFGARLTAPFWTLTESEVAQALAHAGEAGK